MNRSIVTVCGGGPLPFRGIQNETNVELTFRSRPKKLPTIPNFLDRFLFAMAVTIVNVPAIGQVTLYDNTELLLGAGERLFHPHEVWMLAQPFRTDQDNTALTSVSIPIGKYGSPSGEVRFAIWDDDNGTPGHVVADVGTISDVSALPFVAPDIQQVLEEVTFQQAVTGLAPDSTYYVVLDFTDTVSSSNFLGDHVANGAVRSTMGTHGAGSLIGIQRNTSRWLNVSEILGERRYLQMSVTAMAEILDGDFDRDGLLTAADIDALTMAVVANSTDLQFDLNHDGTVDLADQGVWVNDFKSTWFGDANLNGEFTSEDMIAVFRAGKYDLDTDAGWAEGDWTGDRRFDSQDLVAAFQDGGYELGPHPAVTAVPEPSCAILLGMGIIGFMRPQRRVTPRASSEP